MIIYKKFQRRNILFLILGLIVLLSYNTISGNTRIINILDPWGSAAQETVRRNSIGLFMTEVLNSRNHMLLFSLIFIICLFLAMTNFSDSWLYRLSRKKIIAYNNRQMIRMSSIFATIFLILTILTFCYFAPLFFKYWYMMLIYLAIEWFALFLFYLIVAQLFQILMYLFLSFGPALVCSILILMFLYFAPTSLGVEIWSPNNFISDLYLNYVEQVYYAYQLKMPATLIPLVWENSLIMIFVILVLEVAKQLLIRQKNFILKERIS